MTVNLHLIIDDELVFEFTLDELIATIGKEWQTPEYALHYWRTHPEPNREIVSPTLIKFHIGLEGPIIDGSAEGLQMFKDIILKYRTSKSTDTSIREL